MADGIVLPLIIKIEDEGISAALMNGKSYSKSIETKILWIVHPETGRILPWDGEPAYLSLTRDGSVYRAELPRGTCREGCLLSGDKENPELHENINLEVSAENHSSILYTLSETIARRKKEMPAGSYTTHLFEKGLDKIRKKVGEEAVELILAQSKEDIVYESADLIYHLLVMLEESGVSIHDLMAELERRDS